MLKDRINAIKLDDVLRISKQYTRGKLYPNNS